MDPLFQLRNQLWIGDYNRAIQEANTLTSGLDDSQSVERDVLMYRAYIGLGNTSLVLSELGESHPAPLQAVRALAVLSDGASTASAKSDASATIQRLTDDPQHLGDITLRSVASLAFLKDADYDRALRCAHVGTSFELQAASALALLGKSRVDLAAKAYAAMAESDDDNTLTQLVGAWVNLARGGAKAAGEAFAAFEELSERFQPTVALLNGMAAACMGMHKFEEAEGKIAEALAMRSNDPDTLANQIVCMEHMTKPKEHIARTVRMAEAAGPAHPFVAKYNSLSSQFDRLAESAVM